MSSWAFDRAKHQFTLDGEPIPSVTGLLKKAGHIDTRWYTPEARERGTATHEAIEAHATGAAQVRPADEIEQYRRSYSNLQAMLRFDVLAVEVPHVNVARRFGGIIDQRISLDGEPWIIELKTGSAQRWHGYQTALQTILWGAKPTEMRRGAIYLKRGGLAVLVPHEDYNDFTEAEICLLEAR